METTKTTKASKRTVAVITGLKAGDPAKLAPQPCLLANVAFELGRVDRKTFLAEASTALRTKQVIGRVFSFHKQELIEGKFIRFESVPRAEWKAEQGRKLTQAASDIPNPSQGSTNTVPNAGV